MGKDGRASIQKKNRTKMERQFVDSSLQEKRKKRRSRRRKKTERKKKKKKKKKKKSGKIFSIIMSIDAILVERTRKERQSRARASSPIEQYVTTLC